jgi:dihydrodipicolinate synthase/N-acetylneuraminate lyase
MPAQSETFSVITGNAQMFQHALSIGSRGGILAACLFAPALALEIYDGMARGDTTAATAAQERFTPLGAKIVGELGVPGVKVAMDRAGLAGGAVRSPLVALDPAQTAAVDELMRSELVAA